MTTSSAVHTAAAWEGLWLPRWPLASDHPAAEGVYRTSRARALAMRYLEHSPSSLVTAVVIDCDHPDAALRAFEQPADHPKPNWVCLSPSGRGHLGWWLTSRVCNTEAARQAPLRFLARGQEGLRRCVGGDPAYVGLLTKNPINPDWETIWGHPEPYSLRELQTVRAPRQLPRKPERACGLGRNCTLFDTARDEIYPLHKHYEHGPYQDWHRVVVQHCHAVNTQFTAPLGGPLPFTEVHSTAASIAGWVWDNFDTDRFREQQRHRGHKGGKVSAKVMTAKKRAANRRRATKFDLTTALELAL